MFLLKVIFIEHSRLICLSLWSNKGNICIISSPQYTEPMRMYHVRVLSRSHSSYCVAGNICLAVKICLVAVAVKLELDQPSWQSVVHEAKLFISVLLISFWMEKNVICITQNTNLIEPVTDTDDRSMTESVITVKLRHWHPVVFFSFDLFCWADRPFQISVIEKPPNMSLFCFDLVFQCMTHYWWVVSEVDSRLRLYHWRCISQALWLMNVTILLCPKHTHIHISVYCTSTSIPTSLIKSAEL